MLRSGVRALLRLSPGLTVAAIAASAAIASATTIAPAKIFGQINAVASSSQPGPVAPRGAPGSWQASVLGPEVALRSQNVTSAALQPAGQQSGRITRVRWQIMSATPAPAGLHIYLCDSQRCSGVSSALSGETTAFAGDSAATAFSVSFTVTGSGRLAPPWRSGNLSIVTDFE